MTIPYWIMLGAVSLIFAALEFAWPWRRQSQLRKGLVSDLIYLVFVGPISAGLRSFGFYPVGPLRYLLNHPTMHIWHHDIDMHGRYGGNFGINLRLWDWVFGTAYMPKGEEQPVSLGFPGLSKFPRGFLAQQAVPWKHRRR